MVLHRSSRRPRRRRSPKSAILGAHIVAGAGVQVEEIHRPQGTKPHDGRHQRDARHHTPPSVICILGADMPQAVGLNSELWPLEVVSRGVWDVGDKASIDIFLPNIADEDPDTRSKGTRPSSEGLSRLASKVKFIQLCTMVATGRHYRWFAMART